MPGIPAYSQPAVSPSRTPSVSRTPSKTPSVSVTPSTSGPGGASVTPTVTPSATPSVTPSISRTPSVTPTNTISVSVTPTISKTPTPTPTPSPSADCSQPNVFSQMQQAALQFMKTDVAYYKANLSETKRNIYGESMEKWFYQPFLIKCTIERNADTIKDEMFGPDVDKTAKLTIPRVAWEQGNAGLIQGANVQPEIGDIVYDRSTERYYEIHNIVVDYYPIVSNVGVSNLNCPPVKILKYDLDCYLTRTSRLNLSPYKLL